MNKVFFILNPVSEALSIYLVLVSPYVWRSVGREGQTLVCYVMSVSVIRISPG